MTDAQFFTLFEFAFLDVAILGLLLWQLWSVRRSIRADEDAAKRAPRNPPG